MTLRARSSIAAALLLGSVLGCATPDARGDRLYREGDLHGAVEAWRESGRSELAARIAEVENELRVRAEGYIEAARKLEEEGRLAESLLDYRLALTLRPDDAETLAHVQWLARESKQQRAALLDSYRLVRTRGDLGAAQDALRSLRRLDPFEATYETEEQRLRAAIAEESRLRRARIREQQATRVESLVEAGRAAFSDEQLDTALDLWRRALLIDPENERIQAYIARAERQLEALERLRADPEAGS